MAGESARESARRMQEKAERLARAAELWELGAEGERRTSEQLDRLPGEEWTVFHDVRWPGRQRANIDHVVVGPPGIFVIDSKNWSGRIVVRDQVLRQDGRARERAVSGVAEAAIAVCGLTRLVPVNHVVPVICFVRDEDVTGWARDVMLCSTHNITAMLTSRSAVLEPVMCQEVALELDASFRAAARSAGESDEAAARGRNSVPRMDPAPRPVASTPPPQRRTPASKGARRRGLPAVLGGLLLLLALVATPLPQMIGAAFVDLLVPDAGSPSEPHEPAHRTP